MFGMFIPGEDEPNLTIIFFKWVVQPPTSKSSKLGGTLPETNRLCLSWFWMSRVSNGWFNHHL